jgi:transposase
MANQRKPMHLIKQIIQLKESGHSIRQISKRLGISRNTLRGYLRQLESQALDWQQLSEQPERELERLTARPAKPAATTQYQVLRERFAKMEQELLSTGVSRYLLWLEYKQQIPEGYQYVQFCYHYRQWKLASQVSLRIEHKAGDKLFVDFAGDALYLTSPQTGELRPVAVFVAILGCSQLTFVRAVMSQSTEDFLGCLAQTFSYLQGVPAAVVPDNLKAAVTKADRYEPELNQTLSDFALHYQTTILPARVRKPKDKSLVEGAVDIVYGRVYAPLRKGVFHSLSQLNAAISELVEKHNQTRFQGKEYSRRQLFEERERPALKALPATPYELKHYYRGKVQKNSHALLSEDKHYYSVPFRYVGQMVKLIYTLEWVEIYCQYERVALHKRSLTKYGYSTHKEHLPSHHQWVLDWNPDYFKQWAARVGEQTLLAVQALLTSRTHPEQTYKSCLGVLSLEKKVGKERLEKACARALVFGSVSYKLIRSILDKGLEQLAESQAFIVATPPLHENIRGKQAYQ